MITLHHAIKISAPRQAVFLAITDINKMSAWHAGNVEGAIAPGKTVTLWHKPESRFSWRTEKLEPDTLIVQTSIQESDSETGKTLIFKFSDLAKGETLVELSHGDWSEQDPHLAFCNTWWGTVLNNLKSFAEQH